MPFGQLSIAVSSKREINAIIYTASAIALNRGRHEGRV